MTNRQRVATAPAGQAFAGWHQFNNDQAATGLRVISANYLLSASFAADAAEKWQSEFLDVGSMAVLSIDLRQRGSPDSKPVGQPHSSTGVEG